MERQPENLEELVDRVEHAVSGRNEISLDNVLDEIGHRSLGPLLLVAGLVTLAPFIGDIPGVPTIMGILVALVAIQLLLRREHFWFPQWILTRSVSKDKLCKVLGWLKRPARFIDRWIRPRLQFVINNGGVHFIAVACLSIAAMMPFMEVIPFSANGAGAALTMFGLSIIARDGLLASIALIITAATVGIVIYNLV
ncbi:MAG: exopolysaccharide biosynthesis protein [Pseudohongiellaceae bacterium]